jgi:hypothetical protein
MIGFIGPTSREMAMPISDSTWVAILVALVLVCVSVPVANRVADWAGDRRVFVVVMVGAVLKLAATPLQAYLVDHVYNGVADANEYSARAMILAEQFRHLHFAVSGGLVGDGATAIAGGVVYAIIGTSSKMAGYLVFSWLAFLGLVLFYRAFTIAFTNGNRLRYAVLLFLFPSLLYWSSTMGKEAPVTLGLGMAALGAAQLLTHRRGGVVLMALGLGLAMVIRPHEALLFVGAFGVAFLFRRSVQGRPYQTTGKLIGIGVIVIVGVFLAARTSNYLHISSLNTSSVTHILDRTKQGNQQSGSATLAGSTSVTGWPKNAYIVLFDPLPFQAHSTTERLASAENTLLLILLLFSLGRLGRLLRHLPSNPYALMCLLYSVVFLFIFANLGNLGLIDRERVLMLPLLFTLFCGPRTDPALEASPSPVRVPAALPLVSAEG